MASLVLHPTCFIVLFFCFSFCFRVVMPHQDVRVYVQTANTACSANKIVAVRMTAHAIRAVALACVRPVGRVTFAPINVRLVSMAHSVRSNANVSKVDRVITSAADVNAHLAIWVSCATTSVRSTLTA